MLHGWMAPSPSVAPGSGTTSSGSTSIRVPSPWQSGQAPKGLLNENDRGSSSSVSIVWSLGQDIFSLNRELAVRVLGVHVDEVEGDEAAGQAERGLHRVGQPALGRLLDREPVDDDLDRVLLLLVELGGSSRPWISPSTRAREKP